MQNIQITGRHVSLTESMKEYIEGSAAQFYEFGPSINVTHISAVVSKDSKNIKFEFNISIAHKGRVIAKDSTNDFYKSVDSATKKAMKEIKQIHDKVTNPKREKLSEVMEEALVEEG
jgi:ribosomal subunit interface protein